MSVEKLLGAYARETQGAGAEEERLQDVIRVSKEAFWKSEMEGETTWLEFLYQQAAYIRKRWRRGRSSPRCGWCSACRTAARM